MAKLDSNFREFLKEIRPTDNQRADLKKGHTLLRERLAAEESLKGIAVCTFLQGSYKRSTLIRPQGGKRSDVDVVVVTNINRNEYPDPDKAMNLFVPFLRKHYKHKYKRQGRSFGIELSYDDLDLVITSAPSLVDAKIYESLRDDTIEEFAEADRWKTEQLYIPDRDAKAWKPTNPLEQMKWTSEKNASTNGHYINVVKAIKWWQRLNWPDERPKGYPLEHLVGQCCPDHIRSIGEGIVRAFENIVSRGSSVPYFPAFGVTPAENVFARIPQQNYDLFFRHVADATKIARIAFDNDSAPKWRELLGNKFPLSKGPFASGKSDSGDPKPRRYGRK